MEAKGTCRVCKRPVWISVRTRWQFLTLDGTPEAFCPQCDPDHLTKWKLGEPPQKKQDKLNETTSEKEEITLRELQLLKLLAQGKLNKEIAAELCVPEQTVKNKLTLVFLKLGVANRTGAVVKALKKGLIEID